MAGHSWGHLISGSNAVAHNEYGAGVFAGYNWQSGTHVMGIEGDVERRNGKRVGSDSVTATGFETTTPSLGSIRGRLGFSSEATMFFVTGGVAFGDVKFKYDYMSSGTQRQRQWEDKPNGLVVGAGIEHKIARTLNTRVEILHYRFSDVIFKDNDFHTTVGRAGISYHFN